MDEIKKTPHPIKLEDGSVVIGEGVDKLVISGEGLKVKSGAVRLGGNYPDMYPWDTPHRHPEEDTYKNFACDLRFPPDGIPVARIPKSIRELKRLLIGGWIVKGDISDEASIGDVVKWDPSQEMWVRAIATPEMAQPVADVQDGLNLDVTQAMKPGFLGVVIAAGAVQAHGIARHESYTYEGGKPIYLSNTEPGKVTETNTGVYVGTALTPGAICIDIHAQYFERYIRLLKKTIFDDIEELRTALEETKAELEQAIKDGDDALRQELETAIADIEVKLVNLNTTLVSIQRQIDILQSYYEEVKEELESGSVSHTVETLADRDAFIDEGDGTIVFVKDASADLEVKKGSACYILVATGETTPYWANITSSVFLENSEDINWDQVKAAIADRHTHANKAILDSIESLGGSGISIGGITIINPDGTLPGGSGGGGGEIDPADLPVWVKYSSTVPTGSDLTALLNEMPENGLLITDDDALSIPMHSFHSFNKMDAVTVSGNYTVPKTAWYMIEVIGGGGGGGGSSVYQLSAGGGGGGSGARSLVYKKLEEGSTVKCIIGAGGTGGLGTRDTSSPNANVSGTVGTDGGESRCLLDSVVIAKAAGGGAGAAGKAGAGGAASSGTIAGFPGGSPSSGKVTYNATEVGKIPAYGGSGGGQGGGVAAVPPSDGFTSGSSAVAGSWYGAGGGGGTAKFAQEVQNYTTPGANGHAGAVLFYYYDPTL